MNVKKINCIIVDDEPIARNIIKGYVSQISHLNCIGEFKNAMEAILFLENREEVIIVFLDINMPRIDGLSMAKLSKSQHYIIFTTAYAEYAVQSYEHDAVDYLLKPFKLNRFTQAVLKVTNRLRSSGSFENGNHINGANSKIYIKSGADIFRVELSEIIYCEAQKNYTKIILDNNLTYSTLMSISKFEKELNVASEDFVRVHRSFIISKQHLSSIGANHIMIKDNKIPIGPQYKESFFELFNIIN